MKGLCTRALHPSGAGLTAQLYDWNLFFWCAPNEAISFYAVVFITNLYEAPPIRQFIVVCSDEAHNITITILRVVRFFKSWTLLATSDVVWFKAVVLPTFYSASTLGSHATGSGHDTTSLSHFPGTGYGWPDVEHHTESHNFQFWCL